MPSKKLGLLIGAEEEDWPSALEAMYRRHTPVATVDGEPLIVQVERVRVHPFDLRADASYDVVVDRLGHWQLNPREWLKKAALFNGVYLLNNPFTFQSMEKHSAYVAMMRLGLHVPKTWLIPLKSYPDRPGYQETASRYYDWFDLPSIAANEFGYPLYMKPFDGGGWRGVSRIDSQGELMRAYDASGQTMMHLQAALEGFDVFVRALGIGPQIRPMRYDPSQPLHARYVIEQDFLSPEKQLEIIRITKVINAFFRWEINSCEAILKDGLLQPIDYANACPDMHLFSLHVQLPLGHQGAGALGPVYCLAHRAQDAAGYEHRRLLRDRRFRTQLRREVGRLRGVGRRLFRDRALRGVPRHATGLAGRGHVGVRADTGVRLDLARHRGREVPAPRA
jgi:hypothetical protein